MSGTLSWDFPIIFNQYLDQFIHYRLAVFLSKMLVTQSCPTLCDPMDCSPPGPSVHGILQARILEWVAISSSKDLPQGSNLGLLHWQADS